MPDVTDEFISMVKEKLDPKVSLSLPEKVLDPNPLLSNRDRDIALFVGHKNELKALSSGVISCLNGFYKRVIVHGEQGIGKTTLVQVISYASLRDDSLHYKTHSFDKNNYFDTFDSLYFSIISNLYWDFEYKHHKDDQRGTDNIIKEKLKKKQKIVSFIMKLGDKDIPTLKEFPEILKKENLIDIKETEDPIAIQNKFLEFVLDFTLTNKLFLIFDDFELLQSEENRQFLQNVKNIMKVKNVFSIVVMYTITFNDLYKKADEILIKDSLYVEMLPFAPGELRDLIRRRIQYFGKNHISNFPNPPTPQELEPFSEKTIDFIADASKGNPLTFIGCLKDAISLANERNVNYVGEDVAKIIIERLAAPSPTLTKAQKQVFEYMKAKKRVTIKEISNFLGKSNVAAYFALSSLYELKLVSKERERRNMIYFLKDKSAKT